MPYEYRLVRRVEFSETDMAGIVHFANFFRYMEACEHAFMRSLGHSVHPGEDAGRSAGGVIGWPRVHAECDYKRPLRFDDEFEIRMLVREKKDKAVTYDFIFRKTSEREPLARGRMVAVCVGRIDGALKGIPIPSDLGLLIDVAPAALLQEQS